MKEFHFERFIQEEAGPLITDLIYVMGKEVSIHDSKGRFLFGDPREKKWAWKFPVKLADEILGWVHGYPKVEYLADFLTYIAEHRVFVKKRYEELEAVQMKAADLERELYAAKARLSQAGKPARK